MRFANQMPLTSELCFVVALLLGSALPLVAQNPEQQARIAFQAGKIALEANQPGEALANFEEVMETLGPFPEILFYAAKAAFEAGDAEKAERYVEECFSLSDEQFEKTPEGEQLYQLAARIKLGVNSSSGSTRDRSRTHFSNVERAWGEAITRVVKTPWFVPREEVGDGLFSEEHYLVFVRTGPLTVEQRVYREPDIGQGRRLTLRINLFSLHQYQKASGDPASKAAEHWAGDAPEPPLQDGEPIIMKTFLKTLSYKLNDDTWSKRNELGVSEPWGLRPNQYEGSLLDYLLHTLGLGPEAQPVASIPEYPAP